MDALVQQKVQLMIELATKKLQTDIQELKTQIAGFQSDIANLRTQMHSGPTRQATSVNQGVVSESPATSMQQIPNQEAPITKAIDRNGVPPSEVSIEKMFYFGNRR